MDGFGLLRLLLILTGSTALALGAAARFGPRRWLVAAFPAQLLGHTTMALALASAFAQWYYGHALGAGELPGPGEFLRAHPAIPLFGLLGLAGMLLGRGSRGRS